MQLDVFIAGESIDLCIPTYEFAEKSDWYSWFNHPATTRYLHHGIFPNTPQRQIEFFTKAMQERLLLIITNKKGKAIGSVSLSELSQTSAGLGIVIGIPSNKNPLQALEAVARITEHAFTKIGIKRIHASQHINLIPWSHRMSLMGYRVEGIERGSFIKGNEIADAIRIACHHEDYERIIASRGGGYGIVRKKCLSGSKHSPKSPSTRNYKNFLQNMIATTMRSSLYELRSYCA